MGKKKMPCPERFNDAVGGLVFGCLKPIVGLISVAFRS
jgi:hypothetical protein